VLHTLNPRLFPDTLAWIAEHAEDKLIFFDAPFLPLVKALAPKLPNVKAWVCMVDEQRMPAAEADAIPGLLNYEVLMKGPCVGVGVCGGGGWWWWW
jgi:acyl-CoA synthetase (AMP-forming)/AMP-acid ligase II